MPVCNPSVLGGGQDNKREPSLNDLVTGCSVIRCLLELGILTTKTDNRKITEAV